MDIPRRWNSQREASAALGMLRWAASLAECVSKCYACWRLDNLQGCLLLEALPEDFALQTGAYGAPTPTFLALPEKKTATSAAETPLPSGSTQNTDTGSEYIATDREGGMIKMAEGGETTSNV
jgi:hypothetical protein